MPKARPKAELSVQKTVNATISTDTDGIIPRTAAIVNRIPPILAILAVFSLFSRGFSSHFAFSRCRIHAVRQDLRVFSR